MPNIKVTISQALEGKMSSWSARKEEFPLISQLHHRAVRDRGEKKESRPSEEGETCPEEECGREGSAVSRG